jgi:hypothetical protein
MNNAGVMLYKNLKVPLIDLAGLMKEVNINVGGVIGMTSAVHAYTQSLRFQLDCAETDKNSPWLGAEEGTRTPTPLRVHGPEPCASANSATSAMRYAPYDDPARRRELHLYCNENAGSVKPERAMAASRRHQGKRAARAE